MQHHVVQNSFFYSGEVNARAVGSHLILRQLVRRREELSQRVFIKEQVTNL